MWLDIETTIELITTGVNYQWGKVLSVFFKLWKNCTQCSVAEDWPFFSQMHGSMKTPYLSWSENHQIPGGFYQRGKPSLELATGLSFLLLCSCLCLGACSSFLGSPLQPTPKYVCVCLRSVSFAVSPFRPQAADPAAAPRSSPSVPWRPRRARVLPTPFPAAASSGTASMRNPLSFDAALLRSPRDPPLHLCWLHGLHEQLMGMGWRCPL